ncbi:MAG: hypothetical protein GF330_10645 [Candidatus Eisenbacteria bacterium]|nr:hypothetical protein [Candidatus Eisenbacteria bacterium]
MTRPATGMGSIDWLAPILYGSGFFLLGLYIHLAYYPIGNVGVETDFYGHVAPAARALSAGQFSVHDFPYKGPLHPLLLAGFHEIFDDWYRAGVLISLLSAVVTLLLVYRLSLRHFGRRVAAAATLSLSLLYPFFVDAHKATTDHLFLMLSVMCIGLLATPTIRPPRVFVAGMIGALAFLTKYYGAILLVGAGAALLFAGASAERWCERWRGLGLFALGFLLIGAPWFWACWKQTGQLLWTQNLQNLGVAFYGSRLDPDDPARAVSSVTALVFQDPLRFLQEYARKLFAHRLLDVRHLMGPLAGLLSLLGLARLLLLGATRPQRVLLVFGAAYASLMAVWFYLPRFFTFLAVVYYMLAFSLFRVPRSARTVDRPSANSVTRGRWREDLGCRLRQLLGWRMGKLPPLGTLLLGASLVLIAWQNVAWTLQVERVNYQDRPLYIIPAADSLRSAADAQLEPPPALISRRPHLAFLSGLRHQRFPEAPLTYEELLTRAQQAGARHLAYGIGEFGDHPELAYLAALDSLPGIRELYRSAKIRIFEIPQQLDLSTLTGGEEILRTRLRIREAERGEDAAELLSEHVQLSALHLQCEQYERGVAAALQGLRRAPEVPQAAATARALHRLREVLALNYICLNRPEEAIATLEANLTESTPAAEGQNATTHEILGLQYLDLGRIEQAREQLQAALEGYRRLGDAARSRSIQARLDSLRLAARTPAEARRP